MKQYKKIIILWLFLISSGYSLPNSNTAENTTPNTKNISLSFQDIQVRSALQLIAQFANINLIMSDKITGNMSLELQNIPWSQALELILKTQGLAKRQMGNVLLIAPIDEIAAREQEELKITAIEQDQGPLQTTLLQINYGKANDLATVLKDKNNSLLSARGMVNVDTRTNTLWVLDTPNKLAEVKHFVKLLDIPVKQVLIEARIVNLDSSYERNIGVRFGITKSATEPVMASSNNNNNLHFDTPTLTTPNSLGLAVIKLGDGFLLDLELSALESEGAGEIISSPHLITANQQTAEIQAGEEIPYQEASSSGATSTTFKKAVLSLQVTPQITPNQKILLNLKVTQDKPGTKLINQEPSIDTREIQTQVLVNNGQTIVLGGIYENRNSQSIERTPFLSSLPILGNLFKHTQKTKDRSELLIFVTPKIID